MAQFLHLGYQTPNLRAQNCHFWISRLSATLTGQKEKIQEIPRAIFYKPKQTLQKFCFANSQNTLHTFHCTFST